MCIWLCLLAHTEKARSATNYQSLIIENHWAKTMMRFDSKRWQGCSLQLTKYTHDIKNAREVIWLWLKNCTAMDTPNWLVIFRTKPSTLGTDNFQPSPAILDNFTRESGDYPSNLVLFPHNFQTKQCHSQWKIRVIHGHPLHCKWSASGPQVVRARVPDINMAWELSFRGFLVGATSVWTHHEFSAGRMSGRVLWHLHSLRSKKIKC
jgi:hypothetical protein